jgi:SAM-dependent methyltransferase
VVEEGAAVIDEAAFNAFEAAGWESKAAGYDGFFGQVTARLAEPLLDAVELRPGERVLDVATGPGYVAGRAAARGASVVGVDIAEAMVLLARRLNPGLEFLVGDAEGLRFQDGSFAALVGNFVLLHLARPERAAGEFFRVLVPGGRLALTVWDVPEQARLFGVFLDAMAAAGAELPAEIPVGPPFFRFSDEQELARLLGDQGFTEVEVKTIRFTHPVSSPDELWIGLLDGTVRTSALIQGQSQAMRERIRAAFDRIVPAYEIGGRYELPVAVKLASARKPLN